MNLNLTPLYMHNKSVQNLFSADFYPMHLLLIQSAHPGLDDPGMPGGDPDLPETPLDAGLCVIILIALIFGLWRIRALKSTPD